MKLSYGFLEAEFRQDGLSTFQMFFGLKRLKQIVAADPAAGIKLCGSLAILPAEDENEVPFHESQWVADLCVQLFEETPIVFLAAPDAPLSAHIFWETFAARTKLKYFELEDGSIQYVSKLAPRTEHLQRFRAKISEVGAALGVPESICEEHYDKFLVGVMLLAAMDER